MIVDALIEKGPRHPPRQMGLMDAHSDEKWLLYCAALCRAVPLLQLADDGLSDRDVRTARVLGQPAVHRRARHAA